MNISIFDDLEGGRPGQLLAQVDQIGDFTWSARSTMRYRLHKERLLDLNPPDARVTLGEPIVLQHRRAETMAELERVVELNQISATFALTWRRPQRPRRNDESAIWNGSRGSIPWPGICLTFLGSEYYQAGRRATTAARLLDDSRPFRPTFSRPEALSRWDVRDR